MFHNLQKGGVVWFTCASGKNRHCMQLKLLDLYKKDHENVGINMIYVLGLQIMFWFYMCFLQVRYDPLFSLIQYKLFTQYYASRHCHYLLKLRFTSQYQLTMCGFSFFCEILLHTSQIDGKHVRVHHSRILSINKLVGDSDFQIRALKGRILARLTSAMNHILQSTYSK